MQDMIIDVRGSSIGSNTNDNLKKLILSSLSQKTVPFEDILLRSIPTMVLYDDKGLEIFDKITYSPDYYLTNAEIDILARQSKKLVSDFVPNDSALIELGCG